MTFVLMEMQLESEIVYVSRYLEFLNMVNTENLQGCTRNLKWSYYRILFFCQQGSINKLSLLMRHKMKLLKNGFLLFHYGLSFLLFRISYWLCNMHNQELWSAALIKSSERITNSFKSWCLASVMQ
jgi:hypothetical protein